MDTLELIDLDSLTSDSLSCGVKPRHTCSVEVAYLWKVRCSGSSKFSCQAWKDWVDNHIRKTTSATCIGDRNHPRAHPLDWDFIPI